MLTRRGLSVVAPPRSRVSAVAGALFLGLLGACATVPQRGQVVMRDVAFPLRDFRLPSGLRVVVEQDTRSPVVAVVALVGAGGAQDPNGKEGLAHVVEHLAFRSRHQGGPSVWTRLEGAGAGSFNAFTSLDHTVYQSMAPKESLSALVALEGQRLSAPLAGVTPEVFAVEREVVRNELRQRNETGYVGQVFSWLHAASFPADHPYARPIIGTHETLSALSLTDAQRFTRAQYRPENVTMVIAGDVDLAAVEQVLRDNLPESWVGTGAPLALETRVAAEAPEPPLAPAPKQIPSYEAAVAAPELYISWVLPRGFDEASAVHDFVRSALLNNLFGAAQNDGDLAGFNTTLVSGTRASLLVVRVVLNKGDHPERSATKVLDQVHETWTQTIHPGEVLGREYSFQAARRSVVSGMLLEAEDLTARAIRRAELTHFMRDVRAYTRSQAALMALDGGKVTDFAYRWLQRERARVILVRPGENGVPALATASEVLPDEVPSAARVSTTAPSALSALSRPVQVLTLDNGMEVLLSPQPGLPVVRVVAAVRGGVASETRPGVAGLASMGAFQESHFEGVASDWGLRPSGSLQKDHSRYAIAGAAGNVGNMLALMAEQLGTTRTSYDYVRFLREQVLPWYAAVDLRPEVRSHRNMLQALYGTHAYGHEDTGAEMAEVDWSDAQSWLEEVHRPANTVVVITGEFDVKEVEPLVRKYLGGWSRGKATPLEAPAAPPLPPPSSRLSLFVTPRPGATQGQVQVGCRLPAATPASSVRYELMAELMKERLWHQLREQRGATYGFHASTWLARGGGAHFLVEGVVDTPQIAPSADAVHRALVELGKAVPEADLSVARSRLLAQEAVAYTTTADWANALLDARLLGFTPAELARRPADLQAVTAEALRKDFAGCAERLVVGITGDEAKTRASFQALSQP